MNDIFISYSRYDTDVVNEIVALLELEGYSIWIDRDGIESGEDFKRVILKAIKESKVILFFSSEHSNVSDWTAKEIGVAVKYKKHIIPIKLDDSNFNEAVEFDLINLDYIDYSKASIRKAMWGKLLKTLRNKIGNGSKELERLEAERKAKEEAERARLERERLERIEAERKAEETKRRAEQERLERERAEAQRKAQQQNEAKLTSPSANAKPKPKKSLWIGIGAAVVVVGLVLLLVLPKKQSLSVSGTANGHDYVDLGLPSGTLWATCNVGADKPEEYGNYYAWGETGTKITYNWDTYKYASSDFHMLRNNMLTKYCNDSYYSNDGFTDDLTVLQSNDDPAKANWGNGWQMPTEDQWEEMKGNATREWTRRNGMEGCLFVAKNGQSLFLPAAGKRTDKNSQGSGHYWSRSLYSDNPQYAESFTFYSGGCNMGKDYRYCGFSVRPVRQN